MAETENTVRWWARFRIPSTHSDVEKTILYESEHASFESVVDIADICVSHRMSAELWYEEVSSEKRDRIYVGWIDELGRVHARRSYSYDVRKLALVLASSFGGMTEIVECSGILSTDGNPALKLAAIEVWAVRSRKDAEGSAYPFDRFLAAEIRVG